MAVSKIQGQTLMAQFSFLCSGPDSSVIIWFVLTDGYGNWAANSQGANVLAVTPGFVPTWESGSAGVNTGGISRGTYGVLCRVFKPDWSQVLEEQTYPYGTVYVT